MQWFCVFIDGPLLGFLKPKGMSDEWMIKIEQGQA